MDNTSRVVDSASSKGYSWFKELIAAAIGVVLLYLTYSITMEVFAAGGRKMAPNSEELLAYARQKDILTIVLGLFATVTGYYLGRVPAEARAEKAENAAKSARDDLRTTAETAANAGAQAARSVAEKDALKESVRRVVDEIDATVGPSSQTLSESQSQSPEDAALARARDRLNALLR